MEVPGVDGAESAMAMLMELPAQTRELVALRLEKPGLSVRQRRFIDEIVKHGNATLAARAVGYRGAASAGKQLLHDPKYQEVQAELEKRLEELEKESVLSAEYIRKYILDILELCPTDYFTVGDRGEWMIDPEAFRKLPHEIKRLVDGVEVKIVRGEVIFKVNFLSKQAALTLASRYTLVQKLDHRVAAVPWDELAADAERESEDPIAKRLADLDKLLAIQESPEAHKVVLAEGDAVRQAG